MHLSFKNKIPTLNGSYLKYGSDNFNRFPSVLITSLYLIVTKYGATIALMEGDQYFNWCEAEHANLSNGFHNKIKLCK